MMLERQKKLDYISVVYNKKDKPFTKYPKLLARYLVRRYGLSNGMKVLDLGCGRGDFLREFIRCGLKGYGVDHSLAAKTICPSAEILQSDLQNDSLPYVDNSLDLVFSKSVIEHLYYPERLVKEIYRVLKPEGLVLTMTPDWHSVYKTFYEDYTHRTPFTITSLQNILKINGFTDVRVQKFRQLPFLWKMPYLNPLSAFISLVVPSQLSIYSKLVKFSKEIMLLSSAIKPVASKVSKL